MKSPASDGNPIQVAARRSGVSPDVIRAWERRYAAVTPKRSATNRRLYSDEDIERLFLLSQVTRAGRRIGDVAGLSLKQLTAMAEADRDAASRVGVSPAAPPREAKQHLVACLVALEKLDSTALEEALDRAALDLSPPALMNQLVLPLMREVGDRWHDGSLRIANEHMTTSIVRSFLGRLQNGKRLSETAPNIVVATPAGQKHELGGLMVAVSASTDGWKVTYLGAELPAEEIAAAARQTHARAVALSIVYPADDPGLAREIQFLGSHLGETIPVIVGGPAAPAYKDALDKIGARLVSDLSSLRDELTSLRLGPPS